MAYTYRNKKETNAYAAKIRRRYTSSREKGYKVSQYRKRQAKINKIALKQRADSKYRRGLKVLGGVALGISGIVALHPRTRRFVTAVYKDSPGLMSRGFFRSLEHARWQSDVSKVFAHESARGLRRSSSVAPLGYSTVTHPTVGRVTQDIARTLPETLRKMNIIIRNLPKAAKAARKKRKVLSNPYALLDDEGLETYKILQSHSGDPLVGYILKRFDNTLKRIYSGG